MVFRQIIHDDLGCASYLIGDEKAALAAVVDPRLEIQDYLEIAEYTGVSIVAILETHTHADHLSGHGQLAAATGAPIYIHGEADPAFAHLPIADGFELELGRVVVRALHTPGHRPEHTSFLLIDRHRGPEPWAVLTGDTLFVNDVARPDLAIEKRAGARAIHRSLREKLLPLPDGCEVWPAHLGGSMCGGPAIDMKISSTIGFERSHNAALAIADAETFVEHSTSGLGPQPPNFASIVALNRGPLLDEPGAPTALDSVELERALTAGALVVDTRGDRDFDDGHIPAAVCIPAGTPGFGTKLGWLAEPGQTLVFAGAGDHEGRRAARLAASVGLLELRSYLGGGIASWLREGRPLERIERLPVAELAKRAAESDLQLLDVREHGEWDLGHIPGSLFQPWHELDELPAGLDPERPVAVLCASGERAATAASLLQRLGVARVTHVTEGGVPSWGELGNPIEITADPTGAPSS